MLVAGAAVIDFQTLRDSLAAAQADIAALRSEVDTLQTIDTGGGLEVEIGTLASNVSALQSNMTAAQSNITALQTMPAPITFAWAGTPVAGSMINIPLTMNLSIPNGLAGSRYYNGTNPLAASTFTLTRLPAGTTLATISVNTSGQGSITGTGSNTLTNADTLRMTATTVGGSLQNVSITIQAARR